MIGLFNFDDGNKNTCKLVMIWLTLYLLFLFK